MQWTTGSRQAAPALSERIKKIPRSVFGKIAAWADQYGAINLGGGTPDFSAPAFIKSAAVQAVESDYNQYAPTPGELLLREGIAKRLYQTQGLSFDPEAEITVCCGATEGLAAALLAVIDPGDEVIIIEPTYTIYVPHIVLCGGKAVFAELEPPQFRLEREALEAKVSPKTKAIIVNSPHNPTGRVFAADELSMIAELCQKYNLLAITDEIYDEIVFDGIEPLKLWTLPGMRERTIIVNGFSKTYSVTGWRLGYIAAPPALTKGIRLAHNYLTISAPTPLQQAAVTAIQAADSYYQELREQYQLRRDLLLSGLAQIGIPCLVPQGGYFLLANFSDFGWSDDFAFTRELIQTVKVAAVPLSGFYSEYPHKGQLWLRFAFCKQEQTLQAALQRLQDVYKLKRNERVG